jgi:hypothetical protein
LQTAMAPQHQQPGIKTTPNSINCEQKPIRSDLQLQKE